MQETWVWSPGRENLMEKEMATHSSTLAWKIARMEKSARLQSMGSQRWAHNWATAHTHTHTQMKMLRHCFHYFQVITIPCNHFQSAGAKKDVSAWPSFFISLFCITNHVIKQLSIISDIASLNINWILTSCLKRITKKRIFISVHSRLMAPCP